MARLLDRSPRGWIFACWLGYFCLFGAFIVTGGLASLFWPASWPSMSELGSLDPAALPETVDTVLYHRWRRIGIVYHMVHLGAFGALLGWLQASALGRSRRTWAALGGLGFLTLFVLEFVRPGLVAGGHPAPVEPILIAAGGGSLAGLYIWIYLRRQGISAGRWLGRWVGGLVLGVIAGAAILMATGPLLQPVARGLFESDEVFNFVGQVIFFTVYGSTVGLVAGWVSRGVTTKIPPRETLPVGSPADRRQSSADAESATRRASS